jgi:hypothetical protein
MILIRKATDGMFTKELNVHLIGADRYESQVARRGIDLDPPVFDAIRESDDGDLYLSYHFKAGQHRETAVTKRVWYIIYDKLLLLERQTVGDAYLAK